MFAKIVKKAGAGGLYLRRAFMLGSMSGIFSNLALSAKQQHPRGTVISPHALMQGARVAC